MRRVSAAMAMAIAGVGCAGPEGAGPRGGATAATAMGTTGDAPALMVRDAFVASFSPDGTQVAFGRSPENSGVSVRDLRTGATRELTKTGRVPAWSPDGRWIAYVVGAPSTSGDDEEVWVVGADGSGARRLAQNAGVPSFSPDGRQVVVHARKQKKVLAIPFPGPGEPAVFYDGQTSQYVSLAADGDGLVFGQDEELRVLSRQSKQKVFAWPTPGVSGVVARLSPDGKRLAFTGNSSTPIGLWVVDVERKRAVQLAVGHFTRPVWSADGQALAVDLREAKRRAIWRMGRGFVERCLDRAAVAEGDLRLGTGACPEALRTPAELPPDPPVAQAAAAR
jgi:Tol biopolymer transport system component